MKPTTHQAIEDFSKALAENPDFIFAYFNRGNAQAEMIDYIHSLEDKSGMTVNLRPGTATTKQEVVVNYGPAIEDYNKVISLDSNFVFAYFNRANVLAKSKKLEEALKDYEKVLRLEPRFAQAYYNRGLVYIYLDQKEKAYEELSIAGELGLLDAYNVIKRYCNKE